MTALTDLRSEPTKANLDGIIKYLTENPPATDGYDLLNTDYAQVTKAGSAGDLMTYTLPADTLSTVGGTIRVIGWGVKQGANAAATIRLRFDGTDIGNVSTATSTARYWILQYTIGMATAGTLTRILYQGSEGAYSAVITSDRVGNEGGNVSQLSKTYSNALALDFSVSSIHASDTVRQDGMVVEFLG